MHPHDGSVRWLDVRSARWAMPHDGSVRWLDVRSARWAMPHDGFVMTRC